MLKKITSSFFSVSCSLLNWGANKFQPRFFGSGQYVGGICAETGQLFEILKQTCPEGIVLLTSSQVWWNSIQPPWETYRHFTTFRNFDAVPIKRHVMSLIGFSLKTGDKMRWISSMTHITITMIFGSSVRCPAMGADHPLYRRSVMIISNGWRMPSSAEPHGRTESTARDEQPMGGSSNR